MVIKPKQRNIAFRCPECTSSVIGLVGKFALKSNLRLSFALSTPFIVNSFSLSWYFPAGAFVSAFSMNNRSSNNTPRQIPRPDTSRDKYINSILYNREKNVMSQAVTYITYIYTSLLDWLINDAEILPNITIGYIWMAVIIIGMLIATLLKVPNQISHYHIGRLKETFSNYRTIKGEHALGRNWRVRK